MNAHVVVVFRCEWLSCHHLRLLCFVK
uniref:Uncharacterized protein n=1 Tax=Vitis vinifera TaxID=29760 RepID=F6H5S2_VITVI